MSHAHAWTLPFAVSSVGSLLCSAWLPVICNQSQARPAACAEGPIASEAAGWQACCAAMLHGSGLHPGPSPENVLYWWKRSGLSRFLLAATLS